MFLLAILCLGAAHQVGRIFLVIHDQNVLLCRAVHPAVVQRKNMTHFADNWAKSWENRVGLPLVN
jgi:hypothetical protein